MDRVGEGERVENAAHAYGFTWWMKAIYLTVAGLTIFAAVFLLTHMKGEGTEEKVWHWIEAAALALSGVYFAAGSFCSCVLIDDYSVNVRGVFVTSSLPRQTIHWFSLATTQGMGCTILYPDAPETKKLIVMHCYGFDEEWHRWVASLKRLPS